MAEAAKTVHSLLVRRGTCCGATIDPWGAVLSLQVVMKFLIAIFLIAADSSDKAATTPLS